MRKLYIYQKTFAVKDEENVVFAVEFASEGNISYTLINTPVNNDSQIINQGQQDIGHGNILKAGRTICISDVSN